MSEICDSEDINSFIRQLRMFKRRLRSDATLDLMVCVHFPPQISTVSARTARRTATATRVSIATRPSRLSR